MTDTLRLKAALVRRGVTIERLSKMVNLSTASLSMKINGKREFKVSEILSMQEALQITDEERDLIFLNRS